MTTGYNEALLDDTGSRARGRYANVPTDQGSSTVAWGSSLTGMDNNPDIHTTKPKWVSPKVALPYYYNGPSTDPWDMHSAEAQRRQASMESWREPAKAAVLDRFGGLLQKYGATNSPGTLWALAQSGLADDTDAIQSLLATDAQAYHNDYAQSLPAQSDSPVAQSAFAGFMDNIWPDDMWAPVEFATRNAFAGLMMPLEALQGSWRGVGGALAEEGGPDFGQAALSVASLLPPVAAIVDGTLVKDNDFQNPWEQTQFGQTLLYGASKGWGEALTTGQAGLDTEKALELINTDPRFAAERAAIVQDPSKQGSIAQGVAKKEGLYGQAGWFVDETSQIGEAQRQSTYLSWAIPGPQGSMTAWTLGRGIVGGTMGADWAGYGFTSGLIDAAASIFGDPTIVGAKLGIVGKSLRGAGLLAEKAAPNALKGAEMALTFGKERRAVQAGIEVTNRNSQKLIDDFNRLTTVKGTPITDAAPMTMEDWAKLDLEGQATVVRTVKEALAAEAAVKAAEPSVSVVHKTARAIRREAARVFRGQTHLPDAWDDPDRFQRIVTLWRDHDKALKIGDAPVGTATPRVWKSYGSIEEARGVATPTAAPTAATPAATTTRVLSREDEDILHRLQSNTGIEVYGSKIGYTREEWDALSGMQQLAILQKQSGYMRGVWPPKARSRASVPVAPATADDATPTLKWRKRLNTFTAGNWKISVGADGRATLNDLTGVSNPRTFVNADKAKEAAAKAEAALAPAAPQVTGVRALGDTLLYSRDGKWMVEDAAGTVTEVKSKQAGYALARKMQTEVDNAAAERAAVYDAQAYDPWFQALSPEDQALWTESVEYMNDLIERGVITLTRPAGARDEEFIKKAISHFQQKKRTAGKKGAGSKYADQADVDAAGLVLSNQSAQAFEQLKGIDTAGVTFTHAPVPGVAQRTVHDGVDAITYWTPERPPVLVDASEQMTNEQAASLFDFLVEVMSQPGMQFKKAAVGKAEKDGLVGQVAEKIKGVEDPLPFIRDVLNGSERSFGRLLNLTAEHGLDGFYDDWLRSQKNAAGVQIDGIENVNRVQRTLNEEIEGGGVWLGDHPLLESYAWPETATTNAEVLAGVTDITDEVLAGVQRTAQRFGLRSLSSTQTEQWIGTSQKALAKAQAQRTKQLNAALATARSAQARLDRDLITVGERFSDPVTSLRTVLQHEAGMTTGAGRGATVSPEAVRWFLFGSGPTAAIRSRTMKVLADVMDDADKAKFKGLTPDTPEWKAAWDEVAPEYLGLLNQLTKNKWSPETYRAVLRNSIENGGEEGLLSILAPRLGVDVSAGSVAMGVKASGKDGLKHVEAFRTSNSVVKRWVTRQMSERPGQREVQLDRAQDVIDAVVKYGLYAKVPSEQIQKYIGKIINADGTFAAVPTNVDVLKSLFNDIGDLLVKRLSDSPAFKGAKGQVRLDELSAAMRDSTRLFLGGSVEKPDVAARIGHGADVHWFVDDAGNRVDIPNTLLDSELINGYLSLPSVDEWHAGMGRIAAAIHRLPSTERLYDIARSVYDNFFRTSLLVFRAAYVIRNSAEMQIRMFLNGHHSIMSDPATLVGMTMSSGLMGKKASRLSKSFAPFENTILDEAFEVGNDEALAFANHVDDYFAITRLSNSLTDPRVYRSTIARGWQAVDVTKPQFAAGWANELILLNRSPLARAVLGNIPGDFKSTRAGLSHEDRVIEWLMSDVESARKVKSQLMAADENFAVIFGSPSMAKDYLFENVNSVLNRVKRFTMDDAVLTDFVKTGRWLGDGKDIPLSRIPRVQDRVNSLRSALRDRYWKNEVNNRAMTAHMQGSRVTVPWIDSANLRKGTGFIDKFFAVANKIERLSSVGPEYRMAYWDRLAELAPGLRASDVPRAMKAARTTLSPLQRMNPDGTIARFGDRHPAWDALKKAADENSDGLLTLDDIHAIASEHAAKHVKGLFYDAAQRNNFWAATRLLFPFGQAWGNTLKEWTKLGAKRPVQVYKALKPLYGATLEGSTAIYETAPGFAFGDYADGMAPWDQDPNGGFFYTSMNGDTSFVTPFVGRAAAVPVNALGALNGFSPGLGALDMQSSTQSMNLALGSDQIMPGTSFLVPMVLDLMPDSEIVDNIMNVVAPFGQRSVQESAMPAWLTWTLGGVGALPIVGGALADGLSPLAPSVKNRNARDAVAILTASGNYDLTDPLSVRRLQDDAANLATSMLLVTGIWKNWMPVSPTAQPGMELGEDDFPAGKETPGSYALAGFSRLFPQYLEENGGDDTAAKEQMVRDFGPAAIFAITGSKSGLSSVPSSQAMMWARASAENMAIAKAHPDQFYLFFPKGDPTDVTARLWAEELTSRDAEYLSAEEIVNRNVGYMQSIQRQRIDFFEANNLVSKEQAEAMRDDVKEAYKDTTAGQQFNSQSATDRVEQVHDLYLSTPSLQDSPAGQAWEIMYSLREEALNEVRTRSGDDSTTLKGEKVFNVKTAYLADLDQVLAQYPDARLLYNMLAKEWD